MKYYKAVKDNVYDPLTGYTLIKNELLTEKERFKKFKALNNKCFEIVEISRKKTFFSFGCRFQYSE